MLQVSEAGRLYDELIKKIFSKSPAPLAYSNLVLRTAQYNENIWEDVLKVQPRAFKHISITSSTHRQSFADPHRQSSNRVPWC
jgi:hypothetical protein